MIKYKIGIDTGVNTGFALSCDGKLQRVESMTITQAMQAVLAYPPGETKLFIEDARKWRGWKGKTKQTEARIQGAGSIKRDAQIWEDWCKENGYQAIFIAPYHNKTKLNSTEFNRITGWLGKTNNHGRDAGMLIYEKSS